MVSEYLQAAVVNQSQAVEAAISRFRDCGVELARFSILKHAGDPNAVHLCVDGEVRFTSRIVFHGADYPQR